MFTTDLFAPRGRWDHLPSIADQDLTEASVVTAVPVGAIVNDGTIVNNKELNYVAVAFLA